MAEDEKPANAPAPSGKKNKKAKNKVMSLYDFIGTSNANAPVVQPTSNWAEEMEDYNPEEEQVKYKINREALPTAPKSVLMAALDESQVPFQPPFTAFVSNLPFDVHLDDIYKFFKNFVVTEIRLQKDSSGRSKGFGHIDFETRDMLISAIGLNELYIKNRPIKVTLQQERERSDFRKDYDFRKDPEDDKTQRDWRRKEPNKQSDNEGEKYAEEGGRGGGGDRYKRSKEGSFERQDRWKAASDSRDRYNDSRDRYSDNRDRYNDSRDRYNDSRDRYSDNRDRYSDNRDRYNDNRDRYSDNRDRYNKRDRYNDNRDRYNDNRDRYSNRDSQDRFSHNTAGRYDNNGASRGFQNNGRFERSNNDRTEGEWRRKSSKDEQDEQDLTENQHHHPPSQQQHQWDRPQHADTAKDSPVASSAAEGRKERQRLNLKPRTKPLEASEDAPSSSIFGGAKPVNTAAKEREVEEKLKQKKFEGRSHKDDDHHSHYASDSHEGTPAEESHKVVPAPPPKVNAWTARREQQSQQEAPHPQNHTGTPQHDSKNQQYQHTNDTTAERNADYSDEGKGSRVSASHSSHKRLTSNSNNSGGGGGGGVWKANRGGARGSDHTHSRGGPATASTGGGEGGGGGGRGGAASKGQPRVKHQPQRIEDMPKMQEKVTKDWSDRNKFDSLLDAEDKAADEEATTNSTATNNHHVHKNVDDVGGGGGEDDDDDDSSSWNHVSYSKGHERLEQ